VFYAIVTIKLDWNDGKWQSGFKLFVLQRPSWFNTPTNDYSIKIKFNTVFQTWTTKDVRDSVDLLFVLQQPFWFNSLTR